MARLTTKSATVKADINAIDLTGCTYASANNSTVTAVSGVANLNGILIKRAGIKLGGGTGANGSIFYGATDKILLAASLGQTSQFLENVIIPAGQRLNLVSGATNIDVFVEYKLL